MFTFKPTLLNIILKCNNKYIFSNFLILEWFYIYRIIAKIVPSSHIPYTISPIINILY